MGEPFYYYKDRLDLLKLSSNFELYLDMSQRVMETIHTCFPDLEIYSVDEAFFYLDNPHLEEEALRIREKVKKWTGIPISVGVAPTKTLAKLACGIAKKGKGIFVLPENFDSLLEGIEVKEVWGVGRALSKKLRQKGIYSVLELKNAEDQWIRKMLGVVGYRTVLELRGHPCFKLNDIPGRKKSICYSSSFGRKVTELEDIYEAVSTFAAKAGKKLRGQSSLAGFLSVFLISNESVVSNHATFPNATCYSPDLIDVAKIGAKKIFDPNLTYTKAGVLLSDFTDVRQPDLIDPLKKDRKSAMSVIDQINTLYGKSKVQFAAEGILKKWKSKKDYSSPKFTTRWKEILKVF